MVVQGRSVGGGCLFANPFNKRAELACSEKPIKSKHASARVDADELLGICSVGRQNTRTMLIFMLVPQFLFLLLGLVAFVVCAFYLHKLGRLPDRKRFDCLVPSATMSHLDATPARCLTFQVDQQGYLDPSYDGINTSEASSACFSGQVCCCCRRSLRWDGISTRLGFFTLLYVIPAISIFICDFYEFLFRDSWLAGDPSTAVSSLLQSHAQFRGRITPEIFLLRTFMSLVTGLATCLWLLSIKGIEPWRHLGKQIESRCARYGYFCFFTLGLKTTAAVAAAAATTAPARPLPDPNNQAYSKTKEKHPTDACLPYNPSTSSTALHPYAVYQHRCSSGNSDGHMAHCDNNERYHGKVLLASRPPAGPGLDAGDQFFLSSPVGTLASGGTLTSVSSPTQASGYYSSATNNNGATRGSVSGGRPALCPPPNTPPLPPFGGRNDPKVPHGSVASNSQYPDWWGSNGVKNFNGPQNRHAIL
ncbi:unnamed protein product [Schistocephalus solidus]|uniref:Frizzled domain-containing protein n=1 Tax=Schistocephalus solidus TaxID=70667 RepID=A0A183TKR6_SCHSO|nr:unnamed protein product [Schistocephalus solidus]